MAKLTKRMRVIREKVDATKQYDINEAIALLKELATAKFVESVDVAVNLGIDAHPDGRTGCLQNLRLTLTGLNHGPYLFVMATKNLGEVFNLDLFQTRSLPLMYFYNMQQNRITPKISNIMRQS